MDKKKLLISKRVTCSIPSSAFSFFKFEFSVLNFDISSNVIPMRRIYVDNIWIYG